MKKKLRHVLWSNINLNYEEDWKSDFEAEYPEMTEDERIELMHDTNGDYLGEERQNLDILTNGILAVADLGRWNGRVSGYREIESGNISDCLYTDCDYAEWIVDERGDLAFTGHHHDGTNYCIYREWKDGVSDEQKENLKIKIYEGRATRADVVRLTQRLGDYVAKVYGFDISKRGQNKSVEEAA